MLEGVRDAQVVDAAKTCSVVDLPARYAACVIGSIIFSAFSLMLLLVYFPIVLKRDGSRFVIILVFALKSPPIMRVSFFSYLVDDV